MEQLSIRNRALTLLLVWLLGLTAGAQEAELPTRLLREGDCQGAAEVALALQRAVQFRDPRLMRFYLLAELGQGDTWLPLLLGETHARVQKDPLERLAGELILAYGSLCAGQPARARPHLETAGELAPRVPGAYGQVAQFLVKSYAFLLDFQAHPDMPRELIRQRHDDAWRHLAALPVQGREELSLELYWVGEAYTDIWCQALPARSEDWRLLEALPHAEAMLVVARQRLGDQEIVPLIDAQSQRTRETYQSLRQQNAAWLADKQLRLDESGAVSAFLVANWHLQQARGWLALGELDQVPEELTQAAAYRASFAYLLQLSLTRLDWLARARPDGWIESSEKLIEQVWANPFTTGNLMVDVEMRYRRGKLRQALHRPAEAAVEYQRGIDLFEQYIREVGGGPEGALALRRFVTRLYESQAALQLAQNRPEDSVTTLERMEQAQTAATFRRADLSGRLPADEADRLSHLETQKSEVRSQDVRVQSLQQHQAGGAELEASTTLLAETRQSYYQAVNDLEAKYPAFARLDVKPINFPKLQRSIPPDTLVVLLFPTEERLYLLEANSQDLKVRQVDVSRQHLEELTAGIRRQIVAFSRHQSAFDWAASEELYGLLVRPIEPELQHHDVVAFVPYGSLVYLPLSALSSGGPEGLLVRRKQVVVLSKATDLDQIFGPPSRTDGTLVAFGNPDGTLPGAAREVQELRQLFPSPRVYLAAEATSDKLQDVHTPEVSYLHLATHGVLDSQRPRQSYLLMGQDQHLTVSDIAGLRLDSPSGDLSLVSLSACQTALGDKSGPDGSDLRSLADAFSLAGSRSLLASLWKVDDRATGDLMVSFYRNLKSGKSKAASLQAAQLEMLARPEYQHPFYWAPFLLIGDWR